MSFGTSRELPAPVEKVFAAFTDPARLARWWGPAGFEEFSPARIVIEHRSAPRYRLVIGLAPLAGGTLVSWSQTFEKPEVARAIEHIVVPANEQNLDRLAAEVLVS